MKVKLTIIAENDSPVTDDLKNLAASKGNKIVNTMQKALDYTWELCKLSCDDDLSRDKLTLVSAELIEDD